MLLSGVYFVLVASLATALDLVGGMSVSAADVLSRHDDNAIRRHSARQVPASSSSRVAVGVTKTRPFRRAFRRSFEQIFGMTTRPRRRATSGVGRVPVYMRRLYEDTVTTGRLSTAVLGAASSSTRLKRHSRVTANTVRSFAGSYTFQHNSSID